MVYKNYIFDFDGVLVDSTRYFAKTIVGYLDELQVTYPKDIVTICMPMGYGGVAKYFHDELRVDKDIKEMELEMRQYVQYFYENEICLKEGALEYLQELKAQNCSLRVLSASPYVAVEACMQRNGIRDMFDDVWSCEQFHLKKSDVEIYGKVAEAIGTTVHDIVFLDDNIICLSTAKKAGLLTVGVYDEAGIEFADKMKETGEYYVYSLNELPAPIPKKN